METVKLYDRDPFLREFTAKVLCCEPGKDGWREELERSEFCPEEGGQPGDYEYLDGLENSDGHERGGTVVLTCVRHKETGAAVTG